MVAGNQQPQAANNYFGLAAPGGVIGPEFCLRYKVVWILKAGFTSKIREIEFKEDDGNVHMKLAQRKWHQRNTPVIVNSAGDPICCHGRKGIWKPRTFICRGDKFDKSRVIAWIESPRTYGSESIKIVRDKLHGSPELICEIVGRFATREFQILSSNGSPLAISNSVKMPKASWWATRKYGYRVTISPHVDLAFMAQLLCYIDERVEEMGRPKGDGGGCDSGGGGGGGGGCGGGGGGGCGGGGGGGC